MQKNEAPPGSHGRRLGKPARRGHSAQVFNRCPLVPRPAGQDELQALLAIAEKHARRFKRSIDRASDSAMTKRTTQLETLILDLFAEGRSLQGACREAGISRSAFLKWMHATPDLKRRYEEAQLFHAQALVDDCLAIADDPFVDLGEGPGFAGFDEGAAMRRARFRMDVRLKVANLYFKRHEAALARQEKEKAAEQAQAEAALEPADEAPAPARPAAPATHPIAIPRGPGDVPACAPVHVEAQGNRATC